MKAFHCRGAKRFFFLMPLFLLIPGMLLFSQDTIKIGASLSTTGAYRESSDMLRRGYQLWVRETNRSGGLLGRPVELILKDDRSDPELARENYRQLIEVEKVDLVLSPYGTPLTLAASEVTEEARMVMVAAASSGSGVWDRGYRYIFGVYSLAERYFIGFLNLLARYGIESVKILHEENPFNQDAARGVEVWAGKLGLVIEENVGFIPGTDKVEDVVDRLDISGREGLIVCSYPDAGYEVLRELRSRRIQAAALAMTITPTHPLFALRVRDLAEGVFAPSHWEPLEKIPYPGTEEFIEAFRPFSHMEPSYHAASAYASCQVLGQAVMATGGMDHEKLRTFIAAMDTVTIIGRFKVDAAGRQIGHNPLLIQWQGGKKEIVYPDRVKTTDPVFPRDPEEAPSF